MFLVSQCIPSMICAWISYFLPRWHAVASNILCSIIFCTAVIWFTGHSQSRTGDWFFRDGTISFEEIVHLYQAHFKHRVLCIISDCSYSGSWVLRAAAVWDSMGIPPCGHHAREHGIVMKIWTSSQPDSSAQELDMVRNIVRIDKNGYVATVCWPHKGSTVCSLVNSSFDYCLSKLSNCCSLPDYCATLGWMAHVRRKPFVYLVRGKDRARPAWHYVLVDEEKENAFKEQVASGNVDVALYGKVIKSGFGKDPPDDVKKTIEKFYYLY